MDVVVLEKRIRQLLQSPVEAPARELSSSSQDICTAYFERMGIPPHYKGYRYLIEGIYLASLHPQWLNVSPSICTPALGSALG